MPFITDGSIKPYRSWKQLLLLLLYLLCGLCVTAFLASIIGIFIDLSSRTGLLVQSSIQCVVAFILPAWLIAKNSSSKPLQFLRIAEGIDSRQLVGLLILFCIAIPGMNWIVELNESMHLPENMAGLESVLRKWEETNANVSAKILDDNSIGGLLSGILVVGILTGFSEEIIFRSALIRSFNNAGMGKNLSIWTAAFIFSFIHFQFFGFVPRLLLGAMFGYLLLWSDSLWLPAIAHATNNSLVVISYWLTMRWGWSDISNFGLPISDNLSFFDLASVIATSLFLIFFRRYFFNRGNPLSSGSQPK